MMINMAHCTGIESTVAALVLLFAFKSASIAHQPMQYMAFYGFRALI
jgi:hypothetical protein